MLSWAKKCRGRKQGPLRPATEKAGRFTKSLAPVLIGLIGLLSLAQTLATSVLERRLKIGILRSLGATSWWIGLVFWLEGLTLAGIAWVLGIAVGLPAAFGMVNLLTMFLGPMDVSVNPILWPITLLFVVTVASLASVAPAVRASRLRVQSALRYE